MPDTRPIHKLRRLYWVGPVLAAFVLLLYFVPLFHLVPLKTARQQSAAAVFDAVAYVEAFWQGPLLESADRAVDAAALLAALKANPADAAKRFGHRLGLSGTSSFFVSGRGEIVAVDDGTVSIALQTGGPAAVLIEMGPVFGNAIRDGSGLLDVSDFPNAQNFNALSAEINRRVEEQIWPLLESDAAVGRTVSFVGGVDIADSDGVPSSLKLVPIVIDFP
jgi:predicted lipoprotein